MPPTLPPSSCMNMCGLNQTHKALRVSGAKALSCLRLRLPSAHRAPKLQPQRGVQRGPGVREILWAARGARHLVYDSRRKNERRSGALGAATAEGTLATCAAAPSVACSWASTCSAKSARLPLARLAACYCYWVQLGLESLCGGSVCVRLLLRLWIESQPLIPAA